MRNTNAVGGEDCYAAVASSPRHESAEDGIEKNK